MTEHVHGCLNCRPGMVPDFSKDDPRYHSGAKCGYHMHYSQPATVNGKDYPLTLGIFTGVEGWALVAGESDIDVHPCPCGGDVCLQPVFGVAEAPHNRSEDQR